MTVAAPGESEAVWEALAPPDVLIGREAGPDSVLLFDVQAAVTLATGAIAVANAGSYEIRYYDPDGGFVRATGRRGDGPGEFRFLRYLARLPEDSILAFDRGNQRVSVFDPAGQFVRSWNTIVHGAPPLQDAVGVTASGDVVMRGFVGGEPEGAGPYLTPEVIGVFRRAASSYVPVDTISSSELAQIERDGRLVPAIRPFGRKSDVVVAGDLIFALDAEAPGAIKVLSPDRGLVRVIQVDQEPTQVTEELKDAWVQSFFDVNAIRSERVVEAWQYGFEHVELPATIPLFRSLASDARGDVCAERYGLMESTPPEYWCYAPDGTPSRIVRLPSGLKRSGFPHQDFQVRLAPTGTLGLWKDSLGVESVALYRIQVRQ
ncbi:MAG: hypothetical protein Q8N53_00680 [Longimicrobiales bacterium]|nr:hypothetical protein [Longimicrobiales bacterium]